MTNPHQNQPVYSAGAPLAEAQAAMIMLHGRGAPAQDILSLAGEFEGGFDNRSMAYWAPQAAGYQWYPNRFIAPLASNEPWFSAAVETLSGLLAQIAAAGIPAERTFLLGFSQGACLALEYVARHPQRYGGVFGLSGALIEEGDQPRVYEGSMAGAPVFLGCSDVDFHIPLARVRRSSQIFRELGATVSERIYPGMDHTINRDEIELVQAWLREVLDA